MAAKRKLRMTVSRVRLEPEPYRKDISNPTWDNILDLTSVLGSAAAQRLELYSAESPSVMMVTGHRDVFHISIQLNETKYYCFHAPSGASGSIVDIGPFGFEASEVCESRPLMIKIVTGFWDTGERHGVSWRAYDATDALSPLNNSMSKAAAEVGAMVQSLQAGNHGGEATLRVRGAWKVSPATWADMKFLARKLELTKLVVVDSDGATHVLRWSQPLGSWSYLQ